MKSVEKHHFDCDCHSDEHTFKFTFFNDDGELFLSAYLSQYRGFLGRVAEAVKYVFGYTSKYGHWDVVMLSRDDAARLAELCQRSVEVRDAYEASLDEAAKQAVDAMAAEPDQGIIADGGDFSLKQAIKDVRHWWSM